MSEKKTIQLEGVKAAKEKSVTPIWCLEPGMTSSTHETECAKNKGSRSSEKREGNYDHHH